jgi:hypothetical protein
MFEGWDNFYIIVGPSAGALIGLMFVVVTLTADSEPRGMERGAQVYITPIAFHFAVVLVLSAMTAVPGLPAPAVAAIIALLGLGGFFYALLTTVRLFGMGREKLYVPDLSDKLFYGVFPSLIYAALVVSAAIVFAGATWGAYGLGAVTMAILLIGIRNAWDLVTAIVKSLSKKRHP